jgi:phosphonate transport system permease protein
MGNLGKLFSEAIENIDRKQVEGVRATGADDARIIRFGYLPQILPVFVSLSLYSFESSTRSATVLGLVGAGGVGMIIIERFRAGLFDQVAFVVLNILVVIAVIDHASGLIRKRFIGEPGH